MAFPLPQKVRRAKQWGMVAMMFVAALAFGFLEWQGSNARAAQDKGGKGAAPKAGLNLNTAKAYQGYTLFSPLYSTKFYLIDMEGRVVKTWEGANTPSSYAYLLPNGNLVRPCLATEKGFATGGGSGGRIQEFNWEGQVVWDYKSPADMRQHHDTVKLPNGNFLMQVWVVRTAQELADAGYRGGSLQMDSLIEVRPTGKTTGAIVWQWNTFDHLVQDHDKSKKNYGDVAAHPELIDVNYHMPAANPKGGDKQKDKVQPPAGKGIGNEFTHINGLSYNAELDQIIMSASRMSEIWIIDHSTTKAEAAGHSGGRSGKGGDLLYRWGNPHVYRAGTAKDQQLFSQHNPHWIPKGLPGAGHILVFNNGGKGRPDGQYSSVDEIVPPVDAKGRYTYKPGTAFGPEKPAWSYTAPSKPDFFSTNISGAQRFPNGNTLICSGANGTFFEVTAEKDVVWKYVNPVKGDAGKGGAGGGAGNHVFRALRYPADYPGLAGKDLTPGKTLEEILKKDAKK